MIDTGVVWLINYNEIKRISTQTITLLVPLNTAAAATPTKM